MTMEPDHDKLVEMLRRMHRIRFFEQKAKTLYDYEYRLRGDDEETARAKGVIEGALHLAIGHEGTEVGTCAALNDDDYVTSSHRGHGHAIAKGADSKLMMAELMGRETGYSRGCGGSMHIFDPDLGLMGGNGIVGGQIPLAAGGAFSALYRGTKQVAVAFFSDGASNQGTFHETLNMASLWRLPVIFLCENNLYAASTPSTITLSIPDIADRGAGYGIPGVVVDGQDIMAVFECVSAAVSRARAGEGPTLIESKTYRFLPHTAGGSEHNNPGELEEWLKRDPILLFESWLLERGHMTSDDQSGLRQEVEDEIEAAEAFGKASLFPKFENMPTPSGVEL
jgi:TPP-dependent pyruvate/acetoin dehydrogenase alpha subunit